MAHTRLINHTGARSQTILLECDPNRFEASLARPATGAAYSLFSYFKEPSKLLTIHACQPENVVVVLLAP